MEEGDESRQEVEAGPAVTETAQPATSPRRREPYRLLCWGVGASVVALARNRVWGTPNLAFFTAISTSLGRNPFTGGRGGLNGDYLMTNLLGPVVARGLGQTAPHAYARLHLVVLVAGVVAVLIATYRRFGFTAARALCVLLALAPVTTVACEWLGQPDAFTLPLALGLVVARRWPARFGLAVLLGLSHGEQGVGIALVAAAVSLVDAVDDQ